MGRVGSVVLSSGPSTGDASSRAFRALLERGPLPAARDGWPSIGRFEGTVREASGRAERIEALEETVLRSAVPVRGFAVRVSDGTTTTVRHVERSLYIGRAPTVPGGAYDGGSELLAIGRGDDSLAATHLQLSVTGSRLHARDLGSLTGAVVAPAAGSSFRLESGGRAVLPPGARVRIGRRVTVTVHEAPDAAQAARPG